MYSFGKSPPRSLQSFGVAGLLGEDCQIFYDSLFSTRHAGRVSDLLSARLRKAGFDELRLRALLLFSIFEAYRNQDKSSLQAPEPGADPLLAEPLVVECGIDEEKVAIGISFTLSEKQAVDTAGIADRIAKGQGKDAFETLLVQLFGNSERLVVRVQPQIRRVEVVSLLALPGKMDAEALKRAVPEIVLLDKSSTAETPKATSYTELGDLDYPELLKGDSPGNQEPASPTGAILSKRLEESTALADALKSRKDEVRIKGGAPGAPEDVVRIKGGPAETQDQTVIKIAGGSAPGVEGDSGAPSAQLKLYQLKVEELQKRISELEAGGAVASGDSAGGEEEDGEEEQQSAADKLKGLFKKGGLKKVWPFKKKSDDEDDEEGEEDTEAVQAVVPPAAPSPAPKQEEAPAPAPAPAGAVANPEAAANSLMVEIQAGSLDRTINKAQKEAADMKKDLSSARAKRWVDGLMGELVAEKARLAEFAKKLNTTIRQKELDFRSKEQGYVEELRRRDDVVRQKNNALNRTKEQLSQVTMTLERLKSASASNSDDAHYKQKYNLAQKMMSSYKDENERLTTKVDDLKNQVQTLQLIQAKKSGPSQVDFQQLQTKFDRASRQAEEFKKANALLIERINESSKKSSGSPAVVEDLKRRLDAAMKLATGGQKEGDQLKLKVEELQREETRLRRELDRALAALKPAKGGGNRAA